MLSLLIQSASRTVCPLLAVLAHMGCSVCAMYALKLNIRAREWGELAFVALTPIMTKKVPRTGRVVSTASKIALPDQPERCT